MQLNDNGAKNLGTQHSMILGGDVMTHQMQAPADAQARRAALLGTIQQDHAQMRQFLSSVQETCPYLAHDRSCTACSGEHQSLCASRAASYLYDLLDLPARHFLHEEAWMSLKESDLGAEHQADRQRELQTSCEVQAHCEAHAQILLEVRETYAACQALRDQGQIRAMYQLMRDRLACIFTNHEALFDRPMLVGQ